MSRTTTSVLDYVELLAESVSAQVRIDQDQGFRDPPTEKKRRPEPFSDLYSQSHQDHLTTVGARHGHGK